MRRRRLLTGALSCLSLVLVGAGCAAIVGLDDEFQVGADGGTSRAGKDSGQAGDDDDDDDDGDATTPRTDAGRGTTDGSSAPFEAGPGWQVDESFGSGGWIVLDTSVSAAPPVVTADGNGALDLAAGDPLDGGALLAVGYDPAAGPPTFLDSTLAGTPHDILVTGASAYLVTSQVISPTAPIVLVVSHVNAGRFDGNGTATGTIETSYPQETCTARRIAGLVDDVMQVVGDCFSGGASDETEFFLPFDSDAAVAPQNTGTVLGGPPQLVTDIAATDAGTWLVGCLYCTADTPTPTGLFTLVEVDGGIPSRGQYAPSNVPTSLSAVLPQPSGDAWVLGISGGNFFLSFANGVIGGTPNTGASSPGMTLLAVGDGGSLQLEPASRTRLAADRAGTYLLVGAIGGPAQVAASVVEPFDAGYRFTGTFASTANTIAAPATASAVVVGGVAVVPVSSASLDDFAYVATTLTVSGGSRIGILRLLRHSLRDE